MDILAVTDFPDIRANAPSSRRRGQHPADPARGRPPRRLVRRPRRGDRDEGGAVRGRPPLGSRSSRTANACCTPTPSMCASSSWHTVYEVGQRSPTGSTTCRDRGGGPPAAGLHHRRCLPHAQRQGRPGHERVDAGRVQPRLEARPRARRPGSPELSRTYSVERQAIAKNLIDFDKEWSTIIA